MSPESAPANQALQATMGATVVRRAGADFALLRVFVCAQPIEL